MLRANCQIVNLIVRLQGHFGAQMSVWTRLVEASFLGGMGIVEAVPLRIRHDELLEGRVVMLPTHMLDNGSFRGWLR